MYTTPDYGITYFLTYLLTYKLTYLQTYLLTYLLTNLLTALIANTGIFLLCHQYFKTGNIRGNVVLMFVCLFVCLSVCRLFFPNAVGIVSFSPNAVCGFVSGGGSRIFSDTLVSLLVMPGVC